MNKLELFLTISGGVIYWQTSGLKGQKWLIKSIDVPFQYCLDIKDNQGAFAVYNHRIKDEHYVSVNCGVLWKDPLRPAPAPYRFHAILPWATYKELGADAFALARWVFSKEVLGRRHGKNDSTKEGELFSPQVYKNFPPKLEAEDWPDVSFLVKHLADKQRLELFIGALIAGVAPPLRFRDEGYASQWSTYDPWSDRKPTNGERLLEELYSCLPYETRSRCNISTRWTQCDFPFHLALDNKSSDNAPVALKRVVESMDEKAHSKAQAVVEQYVNPLFQAIEKEDNESLNHLRRTFTMPPESPDEPPRIAKPPKAHNYFEKFIILCNLLIIHKAELAKYLKLLYANFYEVFSNAWVAMTKQPFFIVIMLVMLLIGFGIASLKGKGDFDVAKLQGKLNQCNTAKDNLNVNLNQCNTAKGELNQRLIKLQGQLAEQEKLFKGTIVINEIAWMGTIQNDYDEWIELYNYGIMDINLDGWKLFIFGTPNSLSGTIKKGEFLVLKRSFSKGSQETSFQWQATFNDALWDDLSNRNKIPLILKDKNDKIIDQVDKWYAGDKNNESTHTMTRKKPRFFGTTISHNWCSSPKNKTPYYIESNCSSCNADYGTPGQWNLCNE